MTHLTGRDLLAAGLPPGPALGAMLARANAAADLTGAQAVLRDAVAAHAAATAARAARLDGLRPAPRDDPPTAIVHLSPETEDEAVNAAAVRATMDALMAAPTVEAGVAMPDACPAGPMGTIPVGGVFAARGAIHPRMHSADVCCSVMATTFGDADPGALLDAIHGATHFGPGGRADFADPASAISERIAANPFFDAKAEAAALPISGRRATATTSPSSGARRGRARWCS